MLQANGSSLPLLPLLPLLLLLLLCVALSDQTVTPQEVTSTDCKSPPPPSPRANRLQIQKPTETQRTVGTALLLSAFTAIGVLLTDLGFVVSFGGAVLGSALVFIFPTLMWINKCKKDAKNGIALKVLQHCSI